MPKKGNVKKNVSKRVKGGDGKDFYKLSSNEIDYLTIESFFIVLEMLDDFIKNYKSPQVNKENYFSQFFRPSFRKKSIGEDLIIVCAKEKEANGLRYLWMVIYKYSGSLILKQINITTTRDDKAARYYASFPDTPDGRVDINVLDYEFNNIDELWKKLVSIYPNKMNKECFYSISIKNTHFSDDIINAELLKKLQTIFSHNIWVMDKSLTEDPQKLLEKPEELLEKPPQKLLKEVEIIIDDNTELSLNDKQKIIKEQIDAKHSKKISMQEEEDAEREREKERDRERAENERERERERRRERKIEIEKDIDKITSWILTLKDLDVEDIIKIAVSANYKYFCQLKSYIEKKIKEREREREGGKKHSKREVLGKTMVIYKIQGDRKEYVKHKGKLTTVKDYKELMKAKKAKMPTKLTKKK